MKVSTSAVPFSSSVAFPFPPRYHCKMEYAEVVTLSSSATAETFGTEKAIRLNSLYNPDAANAVKPLGFSTLAGIYARYRVNRIHVMVRAHSAPVQLWVVAAHVPPSSTFSTSATTVTQLVNNPYCLVSPLAPEALGTPQSFVTFEMEDNIWDLMGYTKAQFDNQMENVCGTDTTTPASGFIPYLLLNAAIASGSGAQGVRFDIKIIADVEWFERDVLTV